MKVVCVIPARGGSKRIPRKNLLDFRGKPLLHWAIEGCLESRHLNKTNIYVTTEDVEISHSATGKGVQVIPRPVELSEDHVWTQDVLKHASDYLLSQGEDYDIMIRAQANSPQIRGTKIDECIDKLDRFGLWEVFTVNEDLLEDAAIHVLLKKVVYQKAFSVYKGVVRTDYMDLHTMDDVAKLNQNWVRR
ncbi:hypothetical protein M1O55_04590 [Dehalococcoidia bacterium]|nr:hypothetical protein [Dehalococcoidia bacterium]